MRKLYTEKQDFDCVWVIFKSHERFTFDVLRLDNINGSFLYLALRNSNRNNKLAKQIALANASRALQVGVIVSV